MTTVTWRRLDDAILRQGETWLRKASNATYNEPQSHTLILVSGSFSRTSTWAQLLAGELTQANGYARQSITFGAGSVSSNIASFAAAAAQITASGASLQFDSAVLVADGATTANKSVVSMTASTDLINVASHGLSSGDAVMFTGAGTIATGLSKNVIYYARDISGDNFKVAATSGGSAIDLTADSSGSLLMRYANGWADLIGVFPSTETILDAQTHSFTINWSVTS